MSVTSQDEHEKEEEQWSLLILVRQILNPEKKYQY